MSRNASLDMSPEEFRKIGHELVEQIAEFLGSLPSRPVTTVEPPSKIRELIGAGSFPQQGTDASELIKQTASILYDHSLFNGHPKFFGYITSSAAPIGMLGDLLASSVNPNVGGWSLSPVASEIEFQTIRWIAELIGYDPECGGVLVSGGNMANMTCFLAARKANADWDLTKEGIRGEKSSNSIVYCSAETHTWVIKAVHMCGMGTDSIRWIETDASHRMNINSLRDQIEKDLAIGSKPFMLIGTAGSVSTGVVDPLAELASISKEYDLWFHADGAYGAFAACLDNQKAAFAGLELVDSIALDPHKWLYAPIEVGCALVRDEDTLKAAFSFRPPYYKFDTVAGEETESFVDRSLQNTRGFRALKVWLAIKQVGREGYERMIADDIALCQKFSEVIRDTNELELFSQSLSIVTFQFVPQDLALEGEERQEYLNDLNEKLLTKIQESGELFVSNAFIKGKYLLRACIVNFRTTEKDIDELPEIILRLGHEVLAEN